MSSTKLSVCPQTGIQESLPSPWYTGLPCGPEGTEMQQEKIPLVFLHTPSLLVPSEDYIAVCTQAEYDSEWRES